MEWIARQLEAAPRLGDVDENECDEFLSSRRQINESGLDQLAMLSSIDRLTGTDFSVP